MASLNGRPISLDALAGLADSAITAALTSGALVATPTEIQELTERRLESGRSDVFNIFNNIGQDIGLVGDATQSGVERATNLGLLLTALIPGGGGTRAIATASRAGNSLRSIAGTTARATAATAGVARRNPGRTALGLGGAALGGSVVAQSLAGEETPPVPTPDDIGVDPTAVQADDPAVAQGLAGLDTAIQQSQSTGSFTGDIPGVGTAQITRLVDEAGNDLGGSIVRIGADTQIIFDDELPSARAEQQRLQQERDDRLTADARAFQQSEAEAQRALSERELSLRERQLEADLLRDLPSVIQAFADPASQLLTEAGSARLRGDLSIPGTGISPVLRQLFGLGEEDTIPIEGASRTSTVQAGGEGEGLGTVDVTEQAGDLQLRQIPTTSFFNALSAQDQDVLNSLFTLAGVDPRDVDAQRRRLAAPGSGRSVVGTVRR